jgi:hypothetical protein
MAIQEILHLLIAERDRLNQAIAALQGPAPRRGRPSSASLATAMNGAAAPVRRGRTFTPAQKKKQAERMKAYWAARRKEK